MTDLAALAREFALQRDHTVAACFAFARRVRAEALREAVDVGREFLSPEARAIFVNALNTRALAAEAEPAP